MIVEEIDRQRTAESYYALARYDRELDLISTYSAVSRGCATPLPEISSRTVAGPVPETSGLARIARGSRPDAGLTYTIQEDVVENPEISSNFAGVRAGLDLWKFISSTTEFTSVAGAYLNLDETDDVRVDWTSCRSRSARALP